MASEEHDSNVGRRTFLGYVFGAVAAFLTAALGIPLAGAAILPTLRGRELSWISVGPVAQFQVGQPKSTQLEITQRDGWIESKEAKGVWVVKKGDKSFTVFNGRCVHLGCAYNWAEAQKQFVCPCHGGIYNLDGEVIAGPPPRPLDTLDWRIEGDNLVVGFADFLLGTASKEAI